VTNVTLRFERAFSADSRHRLLPRHPRQAATDLRAIRIQTKCYDGDREKTCQDGTESLRKYSAMTDLSQAVRALLAARSATA